MKFKVLQEDLSIALSSSIRFIATRATLPILGNFALVAKEATLQILATNLEMSIAVNIGGKVDKEGTITIPAKIFYELISNLSKGQTDFELVKEELKIESPQFKGSIPTSPSNDFPKIPDSINKDKSFALNEKDLSDTLGKILFSASLDETRPVLTGVLFIFENNTLILVSSDGFRLSKKTIKLKNKIQSKNLIIPRQSLSELLKHVSESDSAIFEVKESENQLVVNIKDTYLSSRLIDGAFPDFEKIIPTSSSTTVNIDKNDLARAIKLASIFAREGGNVIKMIVKEDKVEITSEGLNSGKQRGELDAKIEGSPVEISFNYKFIEDFLSVCKSESIEIKLIDSVSPAIFVDSNDTDFLHLIMPVRIQS